MSSRRDFKRTVNKCCLHVVYECFTFLEHTPSLNQENTQLIISEAIDLRNRLIYEINHPEMSSYLLNGSGSFYRNLKLELLGKTSNLLDRLNNLPR